METNLASNDSFSIFFIVSLFLLFVVHQILQFRQKRKAGKVIEEIEDWEGLLFSRKISLVLSLLSLMVFFFLLLIRDRTYLIIPILLTIDHLYVLRSNVKIYENGISIGQNFSTYDNIEISEPFNNEVIVYLRYGIKNMEKANFKMKANSEELQLIKSKKAFFESLEHKKA